MLSLHNFSNVLSATSSDRRLFLSHRTQEEKAFQTMALLHRSTIFATTRPWRLSFRTTSTQSHQNSQTQRLVATLMARRAIRQARSRACQCSRTLDLNIFSRRRLHLPRTALSRALLCARTTHASALRRRAASFRRRLQRPTATRACFPCTATSAQISKLLQTAPRFHRATAMAQTF